ncbi:MAG: radical SAM protein [Pseudomonadota bacterium]
MSTSRHPYSDSVAVQGQPEPAQADYAFRFPLQPEVASGRTDLKEVLAGHLKALLEVLVPTSSGREVTIDGFMLLNQRDMIHELYPEEEQKEHHPPDPLDVYEPRLRYIQHLLESLSAVVDFEFEGRKVRVDGFRLKNLDQWRGPGGGASDILAQAASRCNLGCLFCYNLGSPPALRPKPRSAEDELQEMLTRIRYYVPGSKQNLFPNAGSPGEILAHPYIADILTALRRKTQEVLRLPTNGSSLTPNMIDLLSRNQPVLVDVSLNSASPTRRRWLMNDPQPRTALESLARLKAARIPYSVVIVPWPFPSREIMLDDLRRTVAYAAGQDPGFIQVSLPGYSRFFSELELFDQEAVWNEVKACVQGLRAATDCPLVLRPGLFEEYLEPEVVNLPRLTGLIKNSPPARAGVRPGDLLLKINGLPVRNRPQARSLLNLLHQSGLTRSSINVERAGKRLEFDLELADYDYPYDPRSATQLGLVFPSSGIPLEWLERLRRMVNSHQAERVLLLTSRLVRPFLKKQIKENLLLSQVEWRLLVPENKYLGGNIFMGDLLVVEDFIEAVRNFLDQGEARPDLVVIPSSPFHLSGWGRDLCGRAFTEVERRLGIAVAVVECDPIFD